MMSILLVLAAIVLLSASGLPAFFTSTAAGRRISFCLTVLGSLTGLAGIVRSLLEPDPAFLRMRWAFPWGEFAVSLDPLSSFFLLLVFIVPALGSTYALGYWKGGEHEESSRKLGLFYGLLAGSMALVLIARDGLLFLIAWEVMALSAWFASTADEHDPDVRRAGWTYLIATHIGTLFLFAMFALWYRETGSFSLVQAPAAGAAGFLFVFALIGFGFKAGFMPLHVWLPGAHANAPSHVSAVMSGVMLKVGIYGLLRMTSLLPAPPLWWGGVLLGIGALTAVLGIAFAVGQSDIKRLLAYSSIENIGIIGMGVGLALLGRTAGRYDLLFFGLGGALLHVLNHGLFKPLLFFNAGAIIHAVHTRRSDLLGGLGKRMPLTMALFLLGAVAISGLPPLNGFVSEWLLYLGFFRAMTGGAQALVPAGAGAVALAMTGALAVACFVKLFGTVFLGLPRGKIPESSRDPSSSMTVPMIVLACGCIATGIVPSMIMPVLGRTIAAWAGSAGTGAPAGIPGTDFELPEFPWITVMGLVLIAAVVLATVLLNLSGRVKTAGRAGTWDCGYAEPTARMQYGGSSFGNTIVKLFSFALIPKSGKPAVNGIFPANGTFRTKVPDTVLERIIKPVFRSVARLIPGIRVVQQGHTYMYVLYVALITIVLLAFGGLGVVL